jgi:sucrose-6-phosphate hydrolase SacC (GH32 family)
MINEYHMELEDDYLYIPVVTGAETQTISFYIKDHSEYRKIMELEIPVAEENGAGDAVSFFSSLPVRTWKGRELMISGQMTDTFIQGIGQGGEILHCIADYPEIHFAPNGGWMNDPNGLVYDGEKYHLFFQYNPVDKIWNNMSWGHAVSMDLLHWTQMETAMLPNEDGTVYSGCGIMNTEGMLGLPRDAMLFFYTCAGGRSGWSRERKFSQKIAYSLDKGRSLKRIKKDAVPFIINENRDPKVYRHEASNGYYMVMFLDGHEYAVLHSGDLKEWKVTQKLTLEDAWECPDLREIPVAGGGTAWIFWTPDGAWYQGRFDGYQFTDATGPHHAYANQCAYAGQTWSGVQDRVILMQWMRTHNPDQCYTGVMGIPREMELIPQKDDLRLALHPVREWELQKKEIFTGCAHGTIRWFR